MESYDVGFGWLVGWLLGEGASENFILPYVYVYMDGWMFVIYIHATKRYAEKEKKKVKKMNSLTETAERYQI